MQFYITVKQCLAPQVKYFEADQCLKYQQQLKVVKCPVITTDR